MASRAEPGRIRVAGGEDLGYLIAADLATGCAEDALLGQTPEAFNAEEAAAHAFLTHGPPVVTHLVATRRPRAHQLRT